MKCVVGCNGLWRFDNYGITKIIVLGFYKTYFFSNLLLCTSIVLKLLFLLLILRFSEIWHWNIVWYKAKKKMASYMHPFCLVTWHYCKTQPTIKRTNEIGSYLSLHRRSSRAFFTLSLLQLYYAMFDFTS